jgi:hypothetical protein
MLTQDQKSNSILAAALTKKSVNEYYRYMENPITTSPNSWFIVDYDDDWFGLKAGDGISRGVPEGRMSDWLELVQSMRDKEEFHTKRLAYHPKLNDEGYYVGITSPRNTNHESEAFVIHDANFIMSLLNDPRKWLENNLKGESTK